MARSNLAALLGRIPKRASYRRYLMASYAESTRLAYKRDVAHFRRWGGRIPSTAMQIARYLAAYAGELAHATLNRRIAAIYREHALQGLRSPARSELVRATLRGIARTYSRKQRQVRPLLPEHLRKMLPHMRGAPGIRDRALLLVGFLGGFRRSELIALDLEHLEFRHSKLAILVRRSKTDQDGVGRRVTIPRLPSPLCAARALERWLKLRGGGRGPLFTAVTSNGTVTGNRLSGSAVAAIVKRRVAKIGLDAAQYSGHSLRSGFVTAAAQAGASTWQIKQQTGHKSDAVVGGYIRTDASTGANVARLIGR